jgi:hypothetical protein
MMSTLARIGILVLVCALLFLSSGANGQSGTSTIRGEVTDPQGKQVSGASVTIKRGSTGFTRTQRTNSAGSFNFELIPPGDYALEVEAAGFKKEVRSVNALVSAVVDADVRLEIGSAIETVRVEVAASAVTVDTEDATLGNNFENQQITQLPLESRNVLNLLTLQPGVTKDGYVAGARSDQSNVTLDGVDINDAQTTSVSNNRDNPTVNKTLAGPVSGPVLRLNAEAIEEFRIWSPRAARITSMARYSNRIATPFSLPTIFLTTRTARLVQNSSATCSAAAWEGRSSRTGSSSSTITRAGAMRARCQATRRTSREYHSPRSGRDW